MKIIPAIDLLEGRAVRLHKGRRDEVTVFSERPWELVSQFAEAGAEMIHVVDLNGAFAGSRAHPELIERLITAAQIPVQVGGGIRDRAALEAVFAAGARRAVLGTAAIKSPDFAARACADFPERIVVAVDARDGIVAVEGWVEASELTATELGRRASEWGAAALLYTDVNRDGAHTGPNVAATATLNDGCSAPVIASGGVSSLDDLRELRDAGVPYAVVGRALYDEHFTLAEAIEAAC